MRKKNELNERSPEEEYKNATEWGRKAKRNEEEKKGMK